MTRELRAIFKRTGEDSYGPKPTNPIYEASTPDGRIWKIERHYWEHPSSSWAWGAMHKKADGTRDYLYGDNLKELALNLGFSLKD